MCRKARTRKRIVSNCSGGRIWGGTSGVCLRWGLVTTDPWGECRVSKCCSSEVLWRIQSSRKRREKRVKQFPPRVIRTGSRWRGWGPLGGGWGFPGTIHWETGSEGPTKKLPNWREIKEHLGFKELPDWGPQETWALEVLYPWVNINNWL